MNSPAHLASLLSLIVSLSLAAAPASQTLHVGKGKEFAIPSAAAAVAKDGAVIEIDAGDYPGDVATWRANDLTIRGVNGRPHIDAKGKNAGGKGTWVIAGNNAIVENIEFSGAAVPDKNGAGIRAEGKGLTVRDCYFHHNEDGILGGGHDGDILIERCEFSHNGHGDGQSHNMYISDVANFTLKFSYTHHANVGHNVKSRAKANYILYNRIMDEKDGNASYEIDLPNGGRSFIIGNLIQKGPKAENAALVCYAAEGGKNPVQELFVIHNTFVNERHACMFVQVKGNVNPLKVANNIFVGKGAVVGGGKAEEAGNLAGVDPKFVDGEKYDYCLKKDSPAIGIGVKLGAVEGFELTPLMQYVHPCKSEKRSVDEKVDAGAYSHAK